MLPRDKITLYKINRKIAKRNSRELLNRFRCFFLIFFLLGLLSIENPKGESKFSGSASNLIPTYNLLLMCFAWNEVCIIIYFLNPAIKKSQLQFKQRSTPNKN